MENIFKGLFDSTTVSTLTLGKFMICLLSSLAVGLIIALAYRFKNRTTKSFSVTLALIPAVVCVVILLVNGSIGAGVAVAGAFSLVRFRSAPGTAKEIAAVFLAMGAGLATGMGYIGYAFLFAAVLCVANIIYTCIKFGESPSDELEKTLRITIPEDLNYTDVFDEILKKFTSEYRNTNVKTANMGSVYKLTYEVKLKKDTDIKQFIDELRCRNGNLEISLSRAESPMTNEL